MGKSFKLGLTTALVAACMSGAALAADTVRWKVPVGFSTELPGLGDTIVYVSQQLNDLSDGRIQLKVYEPGKLVPAFSILEAVKDKKVEAGYTWVGYDQGKVPSAPLFAAAPFGLEPWEFTAWWYEGGGRQLGEEVFAEHGVHPILCSIIGPEAAGWFRKEIKSLDDLKGLKIRFAGLGGKVMQKLGASVTVLPAGEIFPALEKGNIDATEFSMPAIDEKLGFDKLVKNYYFPGWHQVYTAEHLLVNKELWAKLDKGSKAAIETACTAGVLRGLSKGEFVQVGAMKNFAGKGVQARAFPEKILRELERVTNEVLAEESAKDAHFKKVLESQRAFEKSYRAWKDKAYLPRNWSQATQ
ncbi:MAG TPA: TRAP transporter substrate-binding protein [Burkholderiaceae bacterium]|nr:TRAP transporter substrate-binding protein [Burkholderiaceae bacterium]